MANLKNIVNLPVVESAEGLNLIVNDNGAAKQIAASAVGARADWNETDVSNPAFIKNKPSKELVYEWNFSTDDEVYEMYENVNEDLSWMTRKQDDVGFEIVAELYAFNFDFNEEYQQHNFIYLEDTFATVSSADSPYYDRCINIPSYDFSYVYKEALQGAVYGQERFIEYPIDDVTTRNFVLLPSVYFNIYNGTHMSMDDWIPTNVENGGFIVIESSENPFKSVKIYKVTH